MDKNSGNAWLQCDLTKARLGAVDEIIRSNIGGQSNSFNEIIIHTLKMGGKKLRPSLYLLCLNTGTYYGKELLFPAAALELIHLASLYHDDVMDQAETRRNSPSVNARWGNMNATYSGNYLFSRAVSILSNYDVSVNSITCQYISDLCLGQLKEAENAYNIQITEKEHIDIIRKKTASLFVLPCQLAGLLGRTDAETMNKIMVYCENVGIGFQIIDDILDISGNPEKTGKKTGTDLKEGVYTYPAIYSLASESSSGELANILIRENLTDELVSKAIEIIKRRGGIEKAREVATRYINQALESISSIPDSETKQSLSALATFIIEREN